MTLTAIMGNSQKLDGGAMFGLAERLTKFHLLHSNGARQTLTRALEAEHV